MFRASLAPLTLIFAICFYMHRSFTFRCIFQKRDPLKQRGFLKKVFRNCTLHVISLGLD